MDEKKLISVIVPCYNEQEVLPMFYKEITKISAQMQEAHPELEFEYLFIDDGSKDRTLRTLRIMAKYDKRVRYIAFSRNFGKESGIYAGLKNAKGDYCVVMDADLQHPPAFLPQMYEAVSGGQYDCATTRRISREGESKVRSWFARLFYRIMNRISQTEIVDGAQDFRFMTRQMVDAVLSMSEYNRFSKGIFSWVGFRVKYLEYENVERAAGTSAWSFWGLFRYSLEGIIGFSTAPLSLSAILGFISCLLGLIMLIVTIIKKLAVGEPVAGYPTVICAILFFGGLQLFCTGILGLYLGKTYLEVKRRPHYIARETEADAEKFAELDAQADAAAEAEDEAAPEADAAEDAPEDADTASALEKAQRLKEEADEEFDALVDAAFTDEISAETEADAFDTAERSYSEAPEEASAGTDAAETETEALHGVLDQILDDVLPDEDAPVRPAESAEAPKPKKEKFEIKIDYDSINFDEDFDDADTSEPADIEEDYDSVYGEDADGEYDEYDDEEYDTEPYEELYEEDDEDYGDDEAPLTFGERAANLWALLKEKALALKDKLAAGRAQDDAADAEDAEEDAEYDEYDEAAYDDEDAEYDDYDDADYDGDYEEEYDFADEDDDEDDSTYHGAHF